MLNAAGVHPGAPAKDGWARCPAGLVYFTLRVAPGFLWDACKRDIDDVGSM
jgi:hypothetical protein